MSQNPINELKTRYLKFLSVGKLIFIDENKIIYQISIVSKQGKQG
jgi:hypothetical protein